MIYEAFADDHETALSWLETLIDIDTAEWFLEEREEDGD